MARAWTEAQDRRVVEEYPVLGVNLKIPGKSTGAIRQRAHILGARCRGNGVASSVKRLFWDIETSPNIGFFWQASEKVWIPPDNIVKEGAVICICYKWEGEDNVSWLHWDDGDDRAMIKSFLAVARKADEMVAHYGDSFDLKWFNTQCLKHGLEPLSEPKTVDTGVIVRKRFRLNSNKLDYIGKLLFGKGKIKTEYAMWKDITLHNDKKALKRMVDYCCEDVRLLEKVYHEVSRFYGPKTHAGVLAGGPKWSCPSCGSRDVSKVKRKSTGKGSVQYAMKCEDCDRGYTVTAATYLEFSERE